MEVAGVKPFYSSNKMISLLPRLADHTTRLSAVNVETDLPDSEVPGSVRKKMQAKHDKCTNRDLEGNEISEIRER